MKVVHFKVVHAREPAPYWRENMIVVISLLLVFVVVAETSYQILEVLSFCDKERTYPPSLKITVITFTEKKSKMKLSGETIFRIRKNLKSCKSRTRESFSSSNQKVSNFNDTIRTKVS